MENGRTTLPTSLGLTIIKQLKEQHGIEHGRTPTGLLDMSFSAEELSRIKELQITDPVPGALEGIEKLPNLRALSVKTTFSTEYTQPKDIPSISDEDVMTIEKCRNLKRLDIVNQTNISEINLTALPGLESVNISKNANLETINGIDKLPELYYLECFGNKSLQEIKGLDKAIAERDLDTLKLDVLLFPKAIGYRFDGSYNQQAVNAMENIMHISWQESIRTRKPIQISHNNMLAMHNKACEILEHNVPRLSSTVNKVVAVEKYLAENVVYDTKSLKHNHTRTSEGPLGLHMRQGPDFGANGAYNCIMFNSCVCEGYTRGEQYLLELCGIKTRNIHCISGRDTMGMSDNKKALDNFQVFNLPDDGYHSIVRIDDCYCMYSDPCWNAGCWQEGNKSLPYTLLTKSEISKDHTLSFEERNIGEAIKQDRSKIAESIKFNDVFKKTKASEVAARRTEVNSQIRGIVKGDNNHVY